MPASIYSHDIRLLICPGCGAPLEVPVAGGYTSCQYCNGTVQIPSRNEPSAPSQPRTSEQERIARLYAQLDTSNLAVPADIVGLLENGMLPDANITSAMRLFLAARASLVAGQDVGPASQRMFVLTIIITQALSRHDAARHSRALIETAAELLPSPAHQQQLRAMLARGSAKQGDLAGAEGWMALLDPYSENIHSDSAYRYARAYIDTLRKDWAAVIRVLGRKTGDLPITGEVGVITSCLRANALERAGELEAAVEELLLNMRASPVLAQHVGVAMQINPNLELCPASYPAALARM